MAFLTIFEGFSSCCRWTTTQKLPENVYLDPGHQVVRQRIWVRSATGNERLFSNNAIQVLMNTMKETFAQRFCSERAIKSAFMNG